jgi:hypothetical protein
MNIQDPQLLAALARLENNPDFGKFQEQYLIPLFDNYVQQCIASDTPGKAQGACLAIQEIQEDLSTAREAFLRSENQREVPLS